MQKFVGSRQGWQANSNGRNWELDIKDRLHRHGYPQYSEPPTLLTQEPYFVHQYKSPFRDAFGDAMTLDFYLYHPWKHPDGLILECKYQEETGSTDKKLFFTVRSLKDTGKRALLMLIGDGFTKSAIRYCLAQQDDRFQVCTAWQEFTRMFSDGRL